MKGKSKTFLYRVHLEWKEARKGVLSSFGKPDIEVATPAEFRGHEGVWTPEDLFVAAVNICIMTTFLYYADREKLIFTSYTSTAEGTLERVGNEFMFSYVKVSPTIRVKNSEDAIKVKKLIELSEKNCLISNSIKSKVEVVPDVLVDGA